MLLSDAETEEDIALLAKQELEQTEEDLRRVVAEITEMILPYEEYDSENAVLEVVPGAGGLEASMFAEEIFNMYLNYINEVGFQVDVTELSRTSVGKQTKFTSSTGITKGVADVSGLNVFGQLK